ncbi:MAG TPA: HD domain-containing protein [Saprospiraceae bacterium]|nr:HD domain-containing protein [Saprospiraceae bacterium]
MPNNKAIEAWVTELWTTQIPTHNFYHNLAHTVYVVEKVIEIGKAEGCSREELELLRVAALLHDIGYIHKRKGHEAESCLLAKGPLKDAGYSNEEIKVINQLIIATKVPQRPHNLLQRIICDADLEYLGTKDAAESSEALYRETVHVIPHFTHNEWIQTQIKFLTGHQYHTDYCKKNSEPGKQDYLRQLKVKFYSDELSL